MPSNCYTESEIIFAYQQICLGKDERDVILELIPGCEYPELCAITLLGAVRSWYRKQTPQRLMELADVPMMEVGA